MANDAFQAAFLATLQKIGAKHSAADKEILNKAHDACAELVGGVHCAAQPNEQQDNSEEGPIGEDVGKRGARHSKDTIDKVGQAHDLLVEVGAQCPTEKADEE